MKFKDIINMTTTRTLFKLESVALIVFFTRTLKRILIHYGIEKKMIG